MTTNASSRKTLNLLANPSVSLLVHDWVSHRPSASTTGGSPPPSSGRSSSLASLLLGLNTAALGRISTTITGTARVLEDGEEEKWCKEMHVENNRFNGDGEGGSQETAYLEGDDVRVVVVEVKEGRISDWKGGVKDWAIREEEGEGTERLVNGLGDAR